MKEDKLLSESFNDNELQNLARIVDFFESQICLDKNVSKEECYFNFNQDRFSIAFKDYETKKNEFITIPINYKLQTKLYKKIDSTFFKEIWINPVILNNITGKPEKRDWYVLNLFGEYSKFMKKTGEVTNDKFFKNIYENFNLSNHLSPAITIIESHKISINDYKDIKKKLYFSIYFLNLKEQEVKYKYPKK
ncbi:hypothetical protein [Polaribacter vadi]|uniref:hypothetical protein n=1 Tax=Polaribacter vadi TaxID=1774273 RepID=UPI0030EC9437